MKLLILSDLHFDEENDWNFINEITQNMINRVSKKMLQNEEIFIVVLGDIINCGGRGNSTLKFLQAEQFISCLRREFSNVKFMFIPGNHDIEKNSFELTSFNEFNKRNIYKKEILFTMENSVFSVMVEGINLIFLDTTLTRNSDLDGKIDTFGLMKNIHNGKNIIFMHHPPCAQEGIERSIINSKELIAAHSNFIFYGHQHGYVKIPDFLEGDTDIHSVGTFLKKLKKINNEFILLDISDGAINYAYRYINNGKTFVPNCMFPSKINLQSDCLCLEKPDKIQTNIIRRLSKRGIEYERVAKNQEEENINLVIGKYNRILIEGETGIGKTFELAKIYWDFFNNDEYFPLWISLYNVNYSVLKNFLCYIQYNTIDRKIPILIIDNINEIEGNMVKKLRKDLGAAVFGNPEVKVILATRTNFNLFFEGFTNFKILPLKEEEIISIAVERGINNIVAFLSALNLTKCFSLAQIPFYLVYLIEIYIETESLPECSQLMDRIVSVCFIKGDEVYPCSTVDSLMGNENIIRSWLKELAFFMQMQDDCLVCNKDYTKYFSPRKRYFFNRTGLLISKKYENTIWWKFEYKIFLEFLVADYLRTVSFKELLNIITDDPEQKILKYSWYNVVAIILSLREDLKNWLIVNNKTYICNLLSACLNREEKNEIFIEVIEKGEFFSADWEGIAHYYQSAITIDFMKFVLQNRINESAIIQVLYILKSCTTFYGKEQKLEEIILKEIKSTNSEEIVSNSIKALANIYSNKLSYIIKKIYSKIENDYRTKIIVTMCDILFRGEVVDEYVDYILDKFKNGEQIFIWSKISQLIKEFNTPEAILKTLKFLCEPQNNGDFYYMFKELIAKLLILYQKGFTQISNESISELGMLFCCDEDKCKVSKQFFVDIGRLPEAFEYILNRKQSVYEVVNIIEAIMDSKLIEIFITKYMNNDLDNMVFTYYATMVLNPDNPFFTIINSAVLKKEGKEIYDREQISKNNLNRKECWQRYFESLFNQTIFCKLLEEILQYTDSEITCGQLLEFDDKIPSERYDLMQILTDFRSYKNENCKVVNFFLVNDWSDFSIASICNFFKYYDNDNLEVSDLKKHILEEYFKKNIEEINFEILNHGSKKYNLQYNKAVNIVFLMERFKFSCSDEKLLEMLVYPTSIFETFANNNIQFVSTRIGKQEKVKARIIENVQKNNLFFNVAIMHIQYCSEHKLIEAVGLAVAIFHNSKIDGLYKTYVADYLFIIKGKKFVDDLIDSSTDINLLRYLWKILNGSYNLLSRIIEENKKTKSLIFLENIMKYNPLYALPVLIEEVVKRQDNLIINVYDSSNVTDITYVMGELCDISLLHYIMDFFEVWVFIKCENDIEYNRILWNICSAFCNMAKIDKSKVENKLYELINKYPMNERIKEECNIVLKKINQLVNELEDRTGSIEETCGFIKKNRKNDYL